MQAAGVQLWIARAAATPPAVLVERARRHGAVEGLAIAQLVQAQDWMRLRARLLLAEMVSRHRPGATLRFETLPSGRMTLRDAGGLNFSVSHADELVGCALNAGDAIGLDIERLDRGAQVLELGSEFFCDAERAELDRLPEGARADRAIFLWTLKEAYSKAIGKGLALKFARVGFAGDAHGAVEWRVGRPWWDTGRWRCAWRDVEGHRIAVLAKARASATLTVCEHSTLDDAPPRRLGQAELDRIGHARWIAPALGD